MLLVWRWNIFRYSYCIHQGFCFWHFGLKQIWERRKTSKPRFDENQQSWGGFSQLKGSISNPPLQLWYSSTFVTWGSDDKKRTLLLQVPWKQQKTNRNWKFQWCSFLEHKKWNLKQKWSSFLVRSPTRRRTLTVPKMHSRCWKVRSRHLKSTKQRYFCEWYQQVLLFFC